MKFINESQSLNNYRHNILARSFVPVHMLTLQMSQQQRYRGISVGRCVIPCAYFCKSVKHTFFVEKSILFKKKDVYNFKHLFP